MILLKRKIKEWTNEELRNLILSERPKYIREKALRELELRLNITWYEEGYNEGVYWGRL